MSAMKQWFLVIVLLMILAPLGVTAQEGEAVIPTGLRPDAPTYAVRGAYPVGTRDLTIDGEMSLGITVWYPALNADNAEETVIYPYEIKMIGLPGVATVTGQAISEAAYDLSAAPYPLVVLSTGFSLGRTNFAWLAEHLASHGFVVIAPEHDEKLVNFDPASSMFWRGTFTRPQEIASVFAYVDEQIGAGGTLDGLIDAQTVAVMGFSHGGYTALATAGAKLDIPAYEARCDAARQASDPDGWLCDSFIPFLADMTAFAGLDAIPTELWSVFDDARVDAVVPMAGDAYLFDQAGLAEITVPVMAIGGSRDTGTPYLWGTAMTYEHVSSTTKAIVTFENAEHMIFASTCEALPWYQDIGFSVACSDPVWDMNRAHDLTNHFTTAFLLSVLKQDSEAATALAPDAVQFLGILYEAQGF